MDEYVRIPNKDGEEISPIPRETLEENDELLRFTPRRDTARVFSSEDVGRYKFIRIFTLSFILSVAVALVAASGYLIAVNERVSREFKPLCTDGWCLELDMDEFLIPSNNNTYGMNVPLLKTYKVQTIILTSKNGKPEQIFKDSRLINLKNVRKQMAVSLFLNIEGPLLSYFNEDTRKEFEGFDGYIVSKQFYRIKMSKSNFDGQIFIRESDLTDVDQTKVSGFYREIHFQGDKDFADKVFKDYDRVSIVKGKLSTTPFNPEKVKENVISSMLLGFSKHSVVAPYNRQMELNLEQSLKNEQYLNSSVVYVEALKKIASIRSEELSLDFKNYSVTIENNDLLVAKKSSKSGESVLLYNRNKVSMVDFQEFLNLKDKTISYKMFFGFTEENIDKETNVVEMSAESALWIHLDL